MDTPGFWTSLEVGYKLTNGKTVFRNYRVNVTELRDVFDCMYENAEYKAGTIPVMSYETENITGIYENHNSKIQEVEADEMLKSRILEAYKKEMTALTLEERSKETPVTSLRFLTVAEHDYIRSISHDRNPNFTGDFRLEDMNTVNFFPVYPSFEETLQLLREAGIDDLGPLDADDVLRIEINGDYYTDEKRQEQVELLSENDIVTLKEDIENECLIVESDIGNELGELSASVSKKILDRSNYICNVYAYVSKLEYDIGSEKTKVTLKIVF